VFPLKRSQVQIQRGVGYVYLHRIYQSNRWAEGGPLSHKQGGLIHQFGAAGLAVTLKKIDYLFDQSTLNARQIRWLEFLCEYDFDIKHIKGKENKVADALSRKVHELHATTISMYMTEIKDRILEAANADLKYRGLVAKLQ
jgi:hypothetical protein